jgi:mono/diheme cytochrome c family protein
MTERSSMCWARAGLAVAVTLAVVAPAHAQQTGAPPFAPAVVDSLAARGRTIYEGSARCGVCHGDEGGGTLDGPDLTDRSWLRGSGTYQEILSMVRHGISRRDAETGNPMPVRGWEPVDDSAAIAVAVYVWTLSREPPRR